MLSPPGDFRSTMRRLGYRMGPTVPGALLRATAARVPAPVPAGAVEGCMRALRGLFVFWLAITAWALLGGGAGCTSPPPALHEAVGFENFPSPQANPIVLSPDGQTSTSRTRPAARVSRHLGVASQVTRTVSVGIEPVGLARAPGRPRALGLEPRLRHRERDRHDSGEPELRPGDRDDPGARRDGRDALRRAGRDRVREQHQGLRRALVAQRDRGRRTPRPTR